MRQFYLFLLLLLLPFVAMAQTEGQKVVITGQVTDTAGLALDGCIVTVLKSAQKEIIAYSVSDANGRYELTYENKYKEVFLRLSGFNVKKETRRIESRSQTIDFCAKEENIIFGEVQLKAQKLWGSRDTLNYRVTAYMKDYDRTIGDVLKQLPGITIENGLIKYQGVAINHFYIEGMDALQGRYNIATEGIKASDVATVQVL